MPLSTILLLACGITVVVATFHPRLGPQIYRTAWPGAYTNRSHLRLARMRGVLLGTTLIMLATIIWLQSFHIDWLTLLSVGLLVLCAGCVLTALMLSQRLSAGAHASRRYRGTADR